MDIISTVVFVLAIFWVLSQLVVTRRKLRTGQVVIPPLFAATLVFLSRNRVRMEEHLSGRAVKQVATQEMSAFAQ